MGVGFVAEAANRLAEYFLKVIEEYNYLNLKINVGLTDADFDANNPEYNFYSK